MHIVSKVPAPLGVSRAEIPASEVERERAIYVEEVKGKPAEMQEKVLKERYQIKKEMEKMQQDMQEQKQELQIEMKKWMRDADI